MARGRDKFLFIHHKMDIWDHLAEERWLREGLAV